MVVGYLIALGVSDQVKMISPKRSIQTNNVTTKVIAS
jgi:hypothetical protein